jgi:hypothetical protein
MLCRNHGKSKNQTVDLSLSKRQPVTTISDLVLFETFN